MGYRSIIFLQYYSENIIRSILVRLSYIIHNGRYAVYYIFQYKKYPYGNGKLPWAKIVYSTNYLFPTEIVVHKFVLNFIRTSNGHIIIISNTE